MADKQPNDINDFWMKVTSLMLAIMVWFIIKTAQDLPDTNRHGYQRPSDKPETDKPLPLSDRDGAEKENGPAEK